MKTTWLNDNIKSLLSAMIVLLPMVSVAQTYVTQPFSGESIKCGTWVANKDTASNWEGDTKTSSDTVWVNEEPVAQHPQFANAVYCPCGCAPDFIEIQKRINKQNGEIQHRTIYHSFHYAEPPKSEFDKVKDRFKKH